MKNFVDDNVQGQIFIEHNFDVVEKYDCKVNCHEAELFIDGFKYTNFTTERFIVKQK